MVVVLYVTSYEVNNMLTKRRSMRLLAIFMSVLIVISFMPIFGVGTVDAASKGKLAKKKITLFVGKTYKQKIIVKGKTVKAKKVKWKSKNKKVATINKKGIIKARKVGSAKMTAKYKKKTFKFKVVVKKKPTSKLEPTPIKSSISVDKTSIALDVNGTQTVNIKTKNITMLDVRCDNENVTWSWGEWNGGNINLDITGLKKGNSKIVIFDTGDNSVQVVINISIKQKKSSISVNKTSIALDINEKQTVNITAKNIVTSIEFSKDNENVTCKWGEWNGDNITLDITGLKEGNSKITIFDTDDKSVQVVLNISIGPNYSIDYETIKRSDTKYLVNKIKESVKFPDTLEVKAAYVGTDKKGLFVNQKGEATVLVLFTYSKNSLGQDCPSYSLIWDDRYGNYDYMIDTTFNQTYLDYYEAFDYHDYY